MSVSAQQSEELKDIQAQIKQKQKQIEKQLAEAKQLQQQLKAAELNIANTAKNIENTRNELQSNKSRQTELISQQQDLNKQVKQQQQALSSQLKSMYMVGEHDFAKMLFNLEDASKMERTFSYYRYLTDARKVQIDEFRALVSKLREVNENLLVKQQELQVLEKEQVQQQVQLEQQQSLRQVTLTKIEKKIDTEAAKIEQLQINEQALLKAIEEAERNAKQGPVDLTGLAKLKGKLMLPTQGKMRNMFGRIRQGQIRWKGVLFNGNTGAPVRAVHDGRVLYADWLRGFGLVTVLSHGDGYMSLYGHNQALLKQVGDTVQSGETIALVGQSGGQSTPNLYFEIRHKGTPVNPSQWFKK
ncbi:murein hydrolase activator EnvC family protein [Aliiglaciecola lipolytica]|uniref:Peptidase, M23/M37 family protein n=1 Tax=Aliiglaciecola lipolytica E3 TaxID=1127673 RepID=K6YXX3_9ALTE|nr:peptidoglycan DD-metalloendopeptidase family protein [Aliiglaciecola lipolytica]GAC16090.1 peptidase, M23/M37 family protein [Aliiglaciecola lipolytica E3]